MQPFLAFSSLVLSIFAINATQITPFTLKIGQNFQKKLFIKRYFRNIPSLQVISVAFLLLFRQVSFRNQREWQFPYPIARL